MMCIIKPIVTGDLERNSIDESLAKIFPQCQFLRPTKIHSITSNSLPDPTTSGTRNDCRQLAKTALTAMEDESEGKPDMVLIIEDLELCNIDQPHIVIQWIRRSICEALNELYSTQTHRERMAKQVQKTVSFHLLSPMVEAYFFADQNSLATAQVPTSCNLHLESENLDLEAFRTMHPKYLQSEGRREIAKSGRHPKDFIEYLSSGTYDEVLHGAPALQQLNWLNFKQGSFGSPFLRSMFEDIADLAGIQNPIGGPTSPLTYPGKSVKHELLKLRNI